MPIKESIVTTLKDYISANYNLSYNVINRNVELEGKPVDDLDLNSIFIACKTICSSASKDLVCSIIYSEWINRINPLIEFVTSYENTVIKQHCIDDLIKSIVTDTPNHDLFIKKWLVSIMASIHRQHSPLMLVLCGGQNTGKTEWFRRLLPEQLEQYYAESKLDGGKDDEILMTKKLIIVDDEMGGKSKQESKKLKEMTSKQTFSIREPFGRVSVDLQRLACLAGTTNDTQILNDLTGNRRLLPVNVISINHELYNGIDKVDLFIEIYRLYKSGYSHNLSYADIQLLNDSTSEFEVSSMEEELVSRYYKIPIENETGMKFVTNSDIISHIKTWSGMFMSSTKLGTVLKKLGYRQETKRVYGNSPQRVYGVIQLNL